MKKLFSTLLTSTTSEDEKYQILCEIADHEVTPELLYDLVMMIKEHQAMQIHAPESIDIVGTWGSWLPRINTSTITSIVLSRLWVPVMKHGSNAASGRFWSMDLLDGLDIDLDLTSEQIMTNYKKHNLAFLYAKKFFPIMKEVWPARKKYALEKGKHTIFNLLWPLLAPASPNQQLIWCSFKEHMMTMALVAKRLGRKNVAVVRGHDGLDEITLTWPTDVIHLRNSEILSYEITPEQAELERVSFDKIAWWSGETNIAIATEILDGTCPTPHQDLIDINVWFVLWMTGRAESLWEWVQKCRDGLHPSTTKK